MQKIQVPLLDNLIIIVKMKYQLPHLTVSKGASIALTLPNYLQPGDAVLSHDGMETSSSPEP
jgi:hypothetical protein